VKLFKNSSMSPWQHIESQYFSYFSLRSQGYEKKRSFILIARPLPISSPGMLKQIKLLKINSRINDRIFCKISFWPYFSFQTKLVH